MSDPPCPKTEALSMKVAQERARMGSVCSIPEQFSGGITSGFVTSMLKVKVQQIISNSD